MAIARVGMTNLVKHSFKGSAKLHGLFGSKVDGVRVDIIEGEVNNQAGAAISLWNHTHGGNSEAQ